LDKDLPGRAKLRRRVLYQSARPDGDSSGRGQYLIYNGPDDRTRCGKGSGELAESLLMLAALDGCKAARQLKHESLVRRRLGGLPCPYTFEEEVDLDVERLCEGVEPACGDSVGALLVLVDLLVGDINPLRHLLLGEAHHDPTLADAGSNLAINVTSAVAVRFRTDWNARVWRTTERIPLKFYAKSDGLFTRVGRKVTICSHAYIDMAEQGGSLRLRALARELGR
jgi:hypothetical protein